MAVDKSKEKEVKELPNNPLHCWSTLGLYTTLALSSALVVISLIIQILTKTTVADPTPVLSFFNIVQTAATGISLAGYFVFLVYPFLNLVKLIFEDISDKESFATNLKFILRSQWFLLLFHLTLVSPLIFAGLNYLSITLIAFNLMLDLYNADLNFKKQGDKKLEYLSYALCLLTTVVTGNWVTGIAFVVIKLFSSYILKRTQRFLDYVIAPKIAKKMYLLYILSMINAYMFCFVLLRNYSNFVDVNSEIMLSGSLGRILGNVFTPNITKMVTWFM